MLDKWGDFTTLLLGIVLEAFPFLLLGSVVSTLIHLFLRAEVLLKLLPKTQIGAATSASLLGMCFPVCECGNVPVARKLIEKKLPAGASISFLLGAPILNPIVILTTIVAFPANPEIWWGRIGLGFLVAVFVGYIFSFAKNSEIINPKFIAKSHSHSTNSSKTKSFADHTASEFLNMGGILILGAGIAATMQTFFPREMMLSIAATPLLSILAMMGLGFVISICSTTDAFFALAYSHQFGSAALVAFLVFGPMIDIKALALMRTTYTTKAIFYLVAIVALLVIFATYFLDTFFW